MSGTLRSLVEQVRRAALAVPLRVFQVGAARRPALADCADVAAVWAALTDDRAETYPARDALTRALLIEHRESGHSLWASVLVVAYYPMLSRLRHRLITDYVPRDELDQLVLTSFLVSLAELPGYAEVDRIAMRLRQRTERQVFASLRKEREQPQVAIEPDELAHGEDIASAGPVEASDDARLDLTLLLERAAEQGITPRGLDVIDATLLQRERLRSYVARMGPDDAVARERTYQRLKRQRTRVLQRLRTLLAPTGSFAAHV